MGTDIFTDIHDVLSGWGSLTDVNRAVLALFTDGNGRATAQLHRNVGPVPTECARGRQADQVGGPDLSREGPFEVCDVPPTSGQAPWILNSLPGCQYRMTSYDDRDTHADLDPAYGIHLHDPRMMEYMGAPESARLLGRTPEYWLKHMGRERTVAAALRWMCIYPEH